MNILSQEFVFSAIEAEKEGVAFPIDFDDVWEMAGYTRKDNAKRALVESGYEIGIDFNILKTEEVQKEGKRKVKRLSENIFLTVDCFKAFCMMARTEEGKATRRYFIEVEKQYRQSLENLFKQETSDRDIMVQALNDAENEILRLEALLEKEQVNRTDFGYSARFVHKVSRIVNYSQVKKAIKRDFVEGRDWMEVEGEIFTNESTFFILVLSFRSLEGTDISFLPEIIKVETKLYFQYQVQRRINSRVGRANQEVEGQQVIPFNGGAY